MREALGKRLRGLRYAVADILYVIGRFLARVFGSAGRALVRIPVASWRGLTGFWRSLSVIARRRLVAAFGVALGLLLLFSVVVPNLPCQFPEGDACPPPDDAEEIVPSDALAYLHASIDPEADQYAAAADLAADLPVLGGELADRALALVPGPDGAPADFGADLRPWIGDEVAVAVVAGAGAGAERVDLLEVDDAELATDYAESLAVGRVRSAEYEGVEITIDRDDVATAQVEGFLAVGTREGVEAVIATATGADEIESLATDETAIEVREELPEHRFAEAWLSEQGVAELIAGDRGGLGTLTPLISPGASRGAAISLSADDESLELAVRSGIDAERERASPGFFTAFPDFDPALTRRLPPRTLAYLGLGAPADTVSSLLEQAGERAPGIAAGFDQLVRALRREANLDVERELLEALGDEAAFALEPAPEGADALASGLPYLLFVADGVDEEHARRGLAGLAGPLAGEADPGAAGQVPVFGEDEVAGVETSSVRISPAVELIYAVFDGLAAVATDPAGIAAVAEGSDDGGLASDSRYERVTEDFPEEPAFQSYLDLEGLVATGEAAGLAEDPVYATFAGDLRRLDALALAVARPEDVLATDARLLVGPAPEPDETAAPLPAPGD